MSARDRLWIPAIAGVGLLAVVVGVQPEDPISGDPQTKEEVGPEGRATEPIGLAGDGVPAHSWPKNATEGRGLHSGTNVARMPSRTGSPESLAPEGVAPKGVDASGGLWPPRNTLVFGLHSEDLARHRRALRNPRELLAEAEQLLAQQRDEAIRYGFLHTYKNICTCVHANRTPPILVELATKGPYRPGPDGVFDSTEEVGRTRTKAIGILGIIADEVAVDTLAGLFDWLEGENLYAHQSLAFSLELAAADAQSPRLIPHLERLEKSLRQRDDESRARDSDMNVRDSYSLRALGSIADPRSDSFVRPYAEADAMNPKAYPEVPHEDHRGVTFVRNPPSSCVALTKIEAMASRDPERSLLGLLESEGAVPMAEGLKSDELYWWTLDRIRRMKISRLAGPMRRVYEEQKEKLDNPALEQQTMRGGRVVTEYPNARFHVAWLDTLHRIGGFLSAEELDRLSISRSLE